MGMRAVSAMALAMALIVVSEPAAQALPATGGGPGGGGLPGGAAARDKDDYGVAEARRDFRLLDLAPDEAAKVGSIVERDARDLELARAQIRESQARLARLMLEAKPDLDAVRATVRQSLESEYRIRMAQIERNIALRELLGDKRWAALSRLVRAAAFLSRKGTLQDLAERKGDDERLQTLLGVLRSMQ